MALFKNLFGKGSMKKDSSPKDPAPVDVDSFQTIEKTDFTSFEELYQQHAALSFEKQFILSDLIASKPWGLNMDKGTIIFEDLEFPVQIIGSLAFEEGTWMWGWANTASNIPENLLLQSNLLKQIGEEKQIQELTERVFPVDNNFEHKVGLVASGLFETKCYYSANYGDGTMIVTIDDDKIPSIDLERTEKILTQFPQLISALSVNHKTAFKNYLIDRQFKINIHDNLIEGIRNNHYVKASFDNQDRLISLDGSLKQ